MTEVLGPPSGIELAPEPRIKDIEFRPKTDAYATDPIQVGVDLDDMFSQLDEKYGVGYGTYAQTVFRSERLPGADDTALTAIDYEAHAQASRYPGFVYYFKGPLDSGGRCLSFCIWETVQDGITASQDPAHVVAIHRAEQFYTSAVIEHLALEYSPDGVAVRELLPPTRLSF